MRYFYPTLVGCLVPVFGTLDRDLGELLEGLFKGVTIRQNFALIFYLFYFFSCLKELIEYSEEWRSSQNLCWDIKMSYHRYMA